jgi:GntR family transcriptional regulator, galactonate operon transcriptional repressor
MMADLVPRSTGSPRAAAGGRVHDAVVRALAGAVLGGRHRPGDILPREADLAVELGVSRTSLREAVKVLAAKGLLESRPRVGVRVRRREDWQMLDPAVLSWHPDFRLDRDLVEGLVEARRIIEPSAAELAARRGTAADLAAIEAAYLSMRAAIPGDLAACCEADLAFHRSVIAASGNVVLRGLSGTIEAALRAVFGVTNQLMTSQSRALAAHGDVLDRIRFRDAAGARSAMNRLLDFAEEDCQRLGELSD